MLPYRFLGALGGGLEVDFRHGRGPPWTHALLLAAMLLMLSKCKGQGAPPVCWTLNASDASPGISKVLRAAAATVNSSEELYTARAMFRIASDEGSSRNGGRISMLYVASATDVAAINVEQAGTSPQATPRWTFAWEPLLEVMTDGSAVQTGSNAHEMTGLVFNPALDLLYLAAVSNRNVYALDASTGRQVWVWTSPWFFNNANIPLALREDRLFVQGANFHLYALNATTGSLLWDSSVPRRWSVLTLPAGDLVLHTDATRNMFAFDAASGNLSWIFRQDGSREYHFDQAVYDSNTRMLYISDDASYLYSIDVRQGTLAWAVNTAETLQAGDDPLRHYVGVAGGVLYTHNFILSEWVPGKERVSALSAWNGSSGALLWSRTLEPLGTLVDFQGNTRWTADLGGTARSPRIISDRLIPDLQRRAFYYVDSKGFLVAMALATGLPGSDMCIGFARKEPPATAAAAAGPAV
ncbi:hypothetical protein HYH03_013665 [Edaphochlamys debaryana]|uniref:Pyrrolo-quinoline quinone repeat domain-containing protein n=1 Tax=Edaphochlamys debaryana TaxID=47281 RepID=A0A835XQ52_9CHLO|nr:hypothetical protein HYH03_013665 [Edaphochlamys debaryana]|eukprot:KAG2487664.1 hypothetical protein HYH03_013665 [Edaphochlamys debaryana]